MSKAIKKTGERTKKPKPLTENDLMKLEIAQELGVMDKVESGGWKSLTARESGRIGGIMASRKRAAKAGLSTADGAESEL